MDGLTFASSRRAQNYSPSSKSMQPYMQTLARTAEFKRIRFTRVDIEAVPDIAEKCNVKALPTYQLYKNGEKLEEMSGALPSKLVAMLKEHNVKPQGGGVVKVLSMVLGIGLTVFGVVKLKTEVEARERRALDQKTAQNAAEMERVRRESEERKKKRAQALRQHHEELEEDDDEGELDDEDYEDDDDYEDDE
jgi:thioredoxin 1